MSDACEKRTRLLQQRLKDAGVDFALLTDGDSIAYFGGYWNYLGIEFGRPTMMVVPADDEPAIVTPLMESHMCREMTWVDNVLPWEDGDGSPWGDVMRPMFGIGKITIGIEAPKMPAIIAGYVGAHIPKAQFTDISRMIGEIRVIKDADEINIMRQAGQVAIAMMEGGRDALGEGVPEYEIALAVIAGGTRKAAEFLDPVEDRFHSPTIHNLQVLQSGHDTCMVHRRSNTRQLEKGDPVYFCMCGIVNFKHYKLGFDRNFFIGSATDEQARNHETTLKAQKTALDSIRPGAVAEEVHANADAVYRDAGLAPGYRTGRAIGYSFLESPELKVGDKTVLQPGMSFAVDGGITVEGQYGTRIGDSIIVTEDGYEYLTPFHRGLVII